MSIWLRKCDKCGGLTDYKKCHICRENESRKEEEKSERRR